MSGRCLAALINGGLGYFQSSSFLIEKSYVYDRLLYLSIPPFFLFVHIIQNHLKCTTLYLLTCSLTTI